MKLLKVTFSLLMLALLIPSGVVTGLGFKSGEPIIVERSDGATGEIQVLSSDTSELTFNVSVPWEELVVETTNENGATYTLVSLPGWSNTSQEGAPRLPMTTEQVGVPFGAEVFLTVTPGEAVTRVLGEPVVMTEG